MTAVTPAPPPNSDPAPAEPSTPQTTWWQRNAQTVIAFTGVIATSIAAVAAVWAGYVGAKALQATNELNRTTVDMAISERFGKATEQLSSDKLSMRIAGVYLLERLANDSPGDLGPITEVLSAFARDQASIQRCEATITPKGIQTGLDAQAVLSALGRMPRGNMRADLSGTCFVGMDLRGTNLSGLDFTGASFVGTRFTNVNFSGSILERAVLSTAQFDQTDLSGTKLSGADLFNARFKATTVAGADFSAANLTAADLSNITGLTMDQFQPPHYYTPGSPYNEPYAYCAANTRWPEGFTPPHCFEWVR